MPTLYLCMRWIYVRWHGSLVANNIWSLYTVHCFVRQLRQYVKGLRDYVRPYGLNWGRKHGCVVGRQLSWLGFVGLLGVSFFYNTFIVSFVKAISMSMEMDYVRPYELRYRTCLCLSSLDYYIEDPDTVLGQTV